jgi:hypothetical protein
MQLMKIFINARVLGNEMWGQSIGHFKILDVQPYVLPNLKFDMPSCFIDMLLISFLNLLQKLLGLGIFFFTPLGHLHNFLGVISLSHENG